MVVKGKKKWMKIVAPREFRNAEIGETTCYDPKDFVGKIVTVSLANLTGEMKKQSVQIIFKIDSVAGEQFNTVVVGYKLLPSYIKRVVRKGRERVDDSFICETKDNIKVKVKPLILTRNYTQRSVLSTIRNKTKEFISVNCKKMGYLEFFNNIILGKLQRELRGILKKVYPIAICEVRELKKL